MSGQGGLTKDAHQLITVVTSTVVLVVEPGVTETSLGTAWRLGGSGRHHTGRQAGTVSVDAL